MNCCFGLSRENVVPAQTTECSIMAFMQVSKWWTKYNPCELENSSTATAALTENKKWALKICISLNSLNRNPFSISIAKIYLKGSLCRLQMWPHTDAVNTFLQWLPAEKSNSKDWCYCSRRPLLELREAGEWDILQPISSPIYPVTLDYLRCQAIVFFF